MLYICKDLLHTEHISDDLLYAIAVDRLRELLIIDLGTPRDEINACLKICPLTDRLVSVNYDLGSSKPVRAYVYDRVLKVEIKNYCE